jgi:hypothetical protein
MRGREGAADTTEITFVNAAMSVQFTGPKMDLHFIPQAEDN